MFKIRAFYVARLGVAPNSPSRLPAHPIRDLEESAKMDIVITSCSRT